jgi:hypothetical protein
MRLSRHAVFRDRKVGRVGTYISDDTGRRAKGPRGLGWCRRYSYEQLNLLTSSSVEGGESGAIVADPEGASGECNETPPVDKKLVSIRRYSQLIRD